MNKAEALVKKGLQAGFGGGTTSGQAQRADFTLTTSHLETSEGVYHDEWVRGGGQELVRAEGDALTRTYVGDTISDTALAELGITEADDVMPFLKRIILEHGNKIRFDSDFEAEYADWKYTYRVTYKRDNPFIINGIEEIYYKSHSVFVHTFGISKVTEG